MGLRLPFTNKQLAKIATVSAVFFAGNAVLMHYLVQKRFHQSAYFMKAAEGVLSHKPLINYLGDPIKFGNPNLSDTTKNYSTPTEAQFEVAIVGSKTKGLMKFSAIMKHADEEPGQSWELLNLEVQVDDRPNEKVVLVSKSIEVGS